jgi:hypothetical protein
LLIGGVEGGVGIDAVEVEVVVVVVFDKTANVVLSELKRDDDIDDEVDEVDDVGVGTSAG